jgi:hypothetical protein
MVTMANNHNLFLLPYWAPALRRVPMPLLLLNEAYLHGGCCPDSALLESSPEQPVENMASAMRSPLPAGRGR